MRQLCETLRSGKRARATFTEIGEPLALDCVRKSKGVELTLRRAGRLRTRTYRGELSVERLEEAFFELYQSFDSERLTTRTELRQLLLDVVLGGMREIDLGSAGTCFAKSFRGNLVLEVTAANGDCLDPTSGDDWSTDALIALLDTADAFLQTRRLTAMKYRPWALARRRLRLRRKVPVKDAAWLY